MERKIGEIFKYNGEWYQCLKSENCDECAFLNNNCTDNPILKCGIADRTDNCCVIFKKLEKVGEPFTGKVHIQLQRYKIYTEPKINSTENVGYIDEGNTIAIELKQNKEDMEEKKLNLKPLDIQKAREGKPVCTRDGRKARIICFDSNGGRPIVALVTECDDEEEIPYKYHCDGSYNCQSIPSYNCQSIPSDYDLMMLSEKREGYVNLYPNCNNNYAARLGNNVIYKDKEFAEDMAKEDPNYIKTVKVQWEE